MAACVQCGTALPRGAAACPSCGTAVRRPRRAAAPAEPAQPAERAAAAKSAKAAAAAKPARKAAAKAGAAGGARRSGATGRTAVPADQAAQATPTAQPAQPLAKPVATAAVRPVVKAVAQPVTPAVKGGSSPARITPTPKVTPPRAPEPDGGPPARRSRRTAAGAVAAAPARRRGVTAETGPDAAPARDSAPGQDARPSAAPPAPAPAAAGSPYARGNGAGTRDDDPYARLAPAAPVAAPDPAPAWPAAAPPAPASRVAASPYSLTPDADETAGGRGDGPPSRGGDVAVGRSSGGWASRRPRRGGGDVIGDADERDHDEPVVPLGPESPAIFDELFEPDRYTGKWPLPVRIARGDWRPSLTAALPALLVTVVVSAIATWGLLQARKAAGDEPLFASPPFGRFVRYACAAVGMVFGGPATFRTEQQFDPAGEDFSFAYAIRFVPLTVTLIGLVAVWFFARRAQERNVTPDRVADSVRIAALYAAGVGAVAALGRWNVTETPAADEEFAVESAFKTTVEMATWRPMFWAFCGAFVAAWLAGGTFAPSGERLRAWLVACRGALAGLGVGLGASLLAYVVLGYVYADRAGGDSSDVTRAIPLTLGYGVDIATAVFGVLCGGRLELPFFEQYPTWSLWAPWVPNRLAVLLAVPALAVAAGAYYIVRRGGLEPREATRACGRMAAPAALCWLLLALAARIGYDSPGTFGGRGGDGISFSGGPVLWNALLVALWFGAGGWLAGRVLVLRLGPRERAAVPDAAPDVSGAGGAPDASTIGGAPDAEDRAGDPVPAGGWDPDPDAAGESGPPVVVRRV